MTTGLSEEEKTKYCDCLTEAISAAMEKMRAPITFVPRTEEGTSLRPDDFVNDRVGRSQEKENVDAKLAARSLPFIEKRIKTIMSGKDSCRCVSCGKRIPPEQFREKPLALACISCLNEAAQITEQLGVGAKR